MASETSISTATASTAPQPPPTPPAGPPPASTAWQDHLAFTSRLAKIELHAHLNGSIRRSTLQELADAAGLDASTARIIHGDARSLVEMFAVFDVIHRAVRGAAVIRRIAREVVEDAAADGVVYLELRTTPRAHAECGMSTEDYVRAVLDGFDDYAGQSQQSVGPACRARLLLSIDRKDPPSTATATVDLAIKYRHRGVVGIDLSGDPSRGEFTQWRPALERAREAGLKIALHAGELAGTDGEMSQMLAFRPDRFGHVCFISSANAATLAQQRTPLELCLTSNILSHAATIRSYAEHHFLRHYPHGHPVVLCTDDTAVFGSPLSAEYAHAMDAFGLKREDVVKLAGEALDAVFLPDGDDDNVRTWVTERLDANQRLLEDK